jgi:hypothetical protein
MGAAQSSTSYTRYSNDFELVIRATKDMEHLLESKFGAPSGKQVGLHDKISHVEQSIGLSKDTVRQMRKLVTSEFLPIFSLRQWSCRCDVCQSPLNIFFFNMRSKKQDGS